MFTAWCTCIFLSAFVIGVRSAPLQDEPFVEKVKEIISDLDNYIAAQNLTELQIPDIDYASNPVKLKNGGFGNFSTIVLQDGTSINETKLKDNTTEYVFSIKLGLQMQQFHYDYQVNTVKFNRSGNFSLYVFDNSAEVIGHAIVRNDNSCMAELATVSVLKYGILVIIVQPNNIPEIDELSDQLLNFVTPYLLPLSNSVLQASLLLPRVQQTFSELACKRITTLYVQ